MCFIFFILIWPQKYQFSTNTSCYFGTTKHQCGVLYNHHLVTVFVKWNLTFYTNITEGRLKKGNQLLLLLLFLPAGLVQYCFHLVDLISTKVDHSEMNPVVMLNAHLSEQQPKNRHINTYHEARNSHRLAFFKRNQQLHWHIICCYTF